MKRKILALILAAALVLTTVPLAVFADTQLVPAYEVNAKKVGKGNNPLEVSYNETKGINYLALGDSVAYGFGTSGMKGETEIKYDFDWLFEYKNPNHMDVRFNYEIPGSYPVLIKNYLEEALGVNNFKQRSVCIARVEDICTFIDAAKYPPDSYYDNMVMGAMLYGVKYNDNGEVEYAELGDDPTYPTTEQLNADIGGAVKSADFITLTAGGNNFYGYLIMTQMLKQENIQSDLSKYYGKAFSESFDMIEQSVVARVKVLDVVSGKSSEAEDSYENQVKKLFKSIKDLLYTTAGFIDGVPELLDLIHQKNPSAKIAVTGMPDAYAEYNIRVGSLIIDLESIVKPAFSILNDTFKNAAEERSSYARYIDISGVDLIKPTVYTPEGFDGETVDIKDLEEFFLGNLDISHPSELGQKQVADRIMTEFKFVKEGEASGNIFGAVKDLLRSLLSITGFSKMKNLLASLMKLDILNIVNLDI